MATRSSSNEPHRGKLEDRQSDDAKDKLVVTERKNRDPTTVAVRVSYDQNFRTSSLDGRNEQQRIGDLI